MLRQWQPHLAVIDMDIAQGAILERLGYTEPTAERTPVPREDWTPWSTALAANA